MHKSEDQLKAEAAAQAEKAAADEAAKKAATDEAAKSKVDDDDGLRPRRPAKVGKTLKVLSKGKTAQVVTDGTRVWKEAIK